MVSHSFLRPLALPAALALAFSSGARAQSTEPVPARLDPVVVTGNPLGSPEIAAPTSVLAGDALTLRRASSLGETLTGLPGVSSSYFGPNASRPVIRGLDGDRVRVLGNGGAALDAATLSFDHAVPIDPLVVDRIEVLRGPAALLYGGNAIGGVVNAMDNRIPRQPLKGLSGTAEVRAGGAERELGAAAVIEGGTEAITWHVDAFGRDTEDLSVPDHVPVEDGTPLESTDRVRNSSSRAQGGALGASLFFDHGQTGLSVDTYKSNYGVVVEPDVRIRMKRDHVAWSGEVRDLGGPLRKLQAQLNHTDYHHEEIEGSGEIGTTFRTRGTELRLQAEHAPLGPVRGVVGVQAEDVDFSALGEEAFVPTTSTRKLALFAVEELDWRGGTLQGGARVERVKVGSEGDADPADARFGPATDRRFSLASASLSNVYRFDSAWSMTAALSHTERAPTAFELFANGVHAATATYERGDPTLGTEKGTNLDVSVAWKKGPHQQVRLGAYTTRFSRYISLDASGRDIDVVEDGGTEQVPEYVFRPVRARLSGVELEGRTRLLEGTWTLDASGKIDLTRGKNLDSGEALPRVAPMRATAGLAVGTGGWTGRAEVEHAARQTRVPSTDRETPSHTLVNLALSRRFSQGASMDGLFFVKLTNVGDRLAYNAASIDTVRGLSPLPGRALKAGVRVSF
ncbi:TonB-dependent receptor [Rhizobacter sp. LjRoot28]|uniref:TonB-dependent receptor n=1 Tax=Rhizobacter sp. LjRoot28 TaxID=3342309 RepID=UPI003ECD8250